MSSRVAVLIASSRFPAEPELTTLESPENDVRRLEEILKDEQTGRFSDVHVLPNLPCQDVRIRLNRVLNEAAKDDLVLIYYSGHGKLDPIGKLCLTMTDTEISILGASSLKVSELQEFIAASRCKRVALILDCCYSGAFGKSLTRGDVEGELQNAAQASGTCIITATSATQTARETPQGLGVFTQHLVHGLKSGEADLDEDGEISHSELFEFVQPRVAAEGHQRPQIFTHVDGRLVLGYSGNKRWDSERRDLKVMLHEAAAKESVSTKVVLETLTILEAGDRRTLSKDHQRKLELLRRLDADDIALGDFREEWDGPAQVDATVASPVSTGEVVPTTPPAPEPIVALEAWRGEKAVPIPPRAAT